MNPFRALVEHLADRLHADADAHARAFGLTVKRLPWGHRAYRHPRLTRYAELRRARILRDGPDALDLALMDPTTRAALAATAARLRTSQRPVRRRAA